jgi:hypothetical protein
MQAMIGIAPVPMQGMAPLAPHRGRPRRVVHSYQAKRFRHFDAINGLKMHLLGCLDRLKIGVWLPIGGFQR